jgi:hypothetical protein
VAGAMGRAHGGDLAVAGVRSALPGVFPHAAQHGDVGHEVPTSLAVRRHVFLGLERTALAFGQTEFHARSVIQLSRAGSTRLVLVVIRDRTV